MDWNKSIQQFCSHSKECVPWLRRSVWRVVYCTAAAATGIPRWWLRRAVQCRPVLRSRHTVLTAAAVQVLLLFWLISCLCVFSTCNLLRTVWHFNCLVSRCVLSSSSSISLQPSASRRQTVERNQTTGRPVMAFYFTTSLCASATVVMSSSIDDATTAAAAAATAAGPQSVQRWSRSPR